VDSAAIFAVQPVGTLVAVNRFITPAGDGATGAAGAAIRWPCAVGMASISVPEPVSKQSPTRVNTAVREPRLRRVRAGWPAGGGRRGPRGAGIRNGWELPGSASRASPISGRAGIIGASGDIGPLM
jgi:hypothetical protein